MKEGRGSEECQRKGRMEELEGRKIKGGGRGKKAEKKEDIKEGRSGRGRWTQNSNFESLSVKMRVGLPSTRLTIGRLGSALSH